MFHGIFVDGFAGGGGASTGIARAIGREVDIAINHDPRAIAVHKANHPTTEHHCQDIRIVWPMAATRHRRVAGAWFSPDCKEHSKAKGGPVKDRNIRQLPMEILPWLKDTRPDVCYVENVEEMQQWGPLDDQGHVIKELRGKEFQRWIRAIRGLGYRVQFRELRACDYGTPTSRKRLYIVMRCDGKKIVWPKPTHGKPDSDGVRLGKLKPYRTAAECIDWSIPVRSIFDRDRPLKPNTERRIAHGVMRYVVNAAKPFIIPVTHSGGAERVHEIDQPLRTITTANGGEFSLVDAVLAPHVTKFRTGSTGSAADQPMPTVTANGEPARPAGSTPLGVAGATLVQIGYGEAEGQQPRVPHVDKPLGTIVSAGKHAVVAAAMAPLQNGERRPGETPREQDIGAPLSTIATGGKHATVAVHLEKFNADSRPKGVDVPLDTVLAGSARHAQVCTFLSRFHTSNTNGGRGDLKQPLGTVTAKGLHHAVVAAHIEQANTGGMLGRRADAPLTTITTKGTQQRIVQTTMIEEGDLPPEMMMKATRCAAFLIKYYGTGLGQPVDEPFATVTTLPRYAVVTVTIDAVTYVIVDIGMRMLTPRELARAQGFPEDYILAPVTPQLIRGKIVHKPLTIADQIRMIGNSVCPDVAAALVAANQPDWSAMDMAA